jgi:predicted nucleic acid-binding protein
MTRILIDTNVIMDYIVEREPFSADAFKIMEYCAKHDVESCIAAHSIPNLFFILRNYLSAEKRRSVLLGLCRIFTVVGIDAAKLESALQNDAFEDFEDCLQVKCAENFDADYIVTRNLKDFEYSPVQAITPSGLLDLLANAGL